MRVLVVGANGGTGRLLVQRLAAANGHGVAAMVRDPAQADELRGLGASDVVVADLEQDVAHAVDGVEAVVFAAGSGSKTGPDKTITVDLMGAIRTIEACRGRGVERFVMLSSMGAHDPSRGGDSLSHYHAAKGEADRWLMATDLDWTIVCPGRLTYDPGTGRVEVAEDLGRRGEITRQDTAGVLAACLDEPATSRRRLEVLAGDRPIEQALREL